MAELHNLRKDTGLVGDAAKSALIAIYRSIADRRDIRIITAKGTDVTTNWNLEHEPTDKDIARNITRNIKNVIIKVTKQQSIDRAGNTLHNTNAEYAILLTEDIIMRLKAYARGVPSISTTLLKAYLVALEPRGDTFIIDLVKLIREYQGTEDEHTYLVWK